MSVQYVTLFACLYVVYRILVADFCRWMAERTRRQTDLWIRERHERAAAMRAEVEARHEAFMIVARADCQAKHQAWLAARGYTD